MAIFLGSGIGGDYPERMKIKTVATINSQDTLANTSNVTIKVYGYYNYDQYTPPNPTIGSQYIKVNDVIKYSGSFNPNFEGTSSTNTEYLMEWTGVLAHNTDGTLSINIKVRQNCPDVITLDYLYGSHTWVLTTIPRMSLITSFPNFDIGSGVTVTAPRDVGAFTNTFELRVGATVIYTTTALSADSYTFTAIQLDAIYALIPNALNITATVYVTTKSGSTVIGTVQSKNATASVGALIIPTTTSLVSAETVALITGLSMGANTFVQKKSKIKFTLAGGAGVKSSTIVEHEIKFNSVTASMVNTTATSNYTFNEVLLPASPLTAIARIKDSRGRWSTPRTLSVTIVPYSSPSVTAFTGFRATSGGVSDVVGEYLKTTITASISSLNSKNQLTYKIAYKLKSDGAYGSDIVSTVLSLGTTSLNVNPLLGNGTTYFLSINSYDVRLIISDKLETIYSYIPISTGKVPASFGKDGIGAGKAWEQGALDIGGDTYTTGNIYMNGSKIIDSGSNSNGYWVRYVDGTQICYGRVDFTTVAMSEIATGASIYMFTGAGYLTQTYANSFTSTPIVSVGTEISEEINCATRTVSTTNFTWILYTRFGFASGLTKKMSYSAIGRWK